MKVIQETLGPVQTNYYVLIDKGHAVVIDPGAPFEKLDSILDSEQATLDAIVLTHAHFDHIGGVPNILKNHDVDVYVSPEEFDFFADDKLNVSSYFGFPFTCKVDPKPLTYPTCTIGHFTFEVIHTPGHTRGSSVLLIDNYMFSGDTLFAGSCGRTDMPTGSSKAMDESLHELKKLIPNYIVYPGHGPASTLEHEKQWNPYME